jgi:hypothetical protein
VEPAAAVRRLAGMLTKPTVARPSRRALALALPMSLIIAACGTAAAPTPSAAAPTPRPTPTAVPGEGGSGAPGGGSGGNTGGGTEPGNPGGGIVFPFPPGPGEDPLLGDATNVVPKAGTIKPHPVNVQLVRAIVQDGNVIIEARWWSGVEECYPTDSVQVDIDEAAKAIHVTVLEGSGLGNPVCIDLAMLKATAVDLGALAAGTWTITAEGDAKPIELEVG